MTSGTDPVLPFRLRTLAMLAVLASCTADASPRQPQGPAPRRVRVGLAERSSRPVLTEVVGTIRATRSATIAPLIPGTVAEVRVGLGSSVRAGDVLVRLSAREVEARLEQTRAVSEQAGRDRARAVGLVGQGAISVAEYETAMSQWSIARARQAEASSIAARMALRAPFAGVITSKIVSVGDTALPGQPLLVLEARSALRLEAQVPETTGESLTVGAVVPVRIEGLDRELAGRLAEIQPASDALSRTRLFKIDLPDTPGLRSGQFGRALLSGAESLAVTVPSEAVVHHGQLESVFVIESGAARVRLVRSGRERDGRVEISSGLAGGETVALTGAGLVDGEQVEEAR
ncbi:MAG TPA: efflux RND transporter periplasmic adaptor subunit [Myxococcaceae bacterium]|jgi:RND family efflux transporter MFP subunit